jgi:hypothetical protein
MNAHYKYLPIWFFCITIMVTLSFPLPTLSQGIDDPFTEGINEGRIGSGIDDPFTEGINEGRIGSGIDDPFTEDVNEGRW